MACPADSALMRRASQEGFATIPLGSAFHLRGALHGAQIVHAHTGRAQNLAFLAAMRLSIARVATRHVAFEPRRPRIHALKYTMACDGIIAVSQAVRSILVKAGVPASKVVVIPNAVETPVVSASAGERRAARLKYGLAERDFAAGHLGAFTPEKGQDVAIEAAMLLSERMPHLRVILAGEGSPAAPPDARVLFPGFVADRNEFFAALDLFIMPSRSEGWGLAAAEALAHGIPVVASHTGGLPEIVEHGETGWLVQPNDPRALASAIADAASDAHRLQGMAAKARSRGFEYSVERTAGLTEKFYRRLHTSGL
jgi:glycosyltransferase involved in cell wall biosynthesis